MPLLSLSVFYTQHLYVVLCLCGFLGEDTQQHSFPSCRSHEIAYPAETQHYLSAKRTFSCEEFPTPGINVPDTHDCMFKSVSIRAHLWKCTSSLLSYCACSTLEIFPLPLNTIVGLTFCSPSALVHSCRVACLLSKAVEGCDTHTCWLPVTSYRFYPIYIDFLVTWHRVTSSFQLYSLS